MDYPFSINIDEYVSILTSLGVTISPDVEKWLWCHKKNLIPHYRFLHFITINHAMQFTRSLVNNFNDMKSIYSGWYVEIPKEITNFDKIAFSLSIYFHYQQFSQYPILKNWILITNEPISLELVYIKELMFMESRNLFSLIIQKSSSS
jgi:hypothetical protein